MDIPGFQIEREIGRGGMARVYLAVQSKFGRLVALKVVSGKFARHEDFRTRFMDESRINAQLTHPNIVQVYDVATHEDNIYLVMEYLSGGDLNQRLARGMHLQAVIKVVKDIGRALDYAHSKGVVHRDIKPENILFREDGSAVLTDFGIARLVATQGALTRTGTVVGTPQYMSPEQAAGRELDGRSDLYGLGIVFYRMLTGDVPFKAETAVAVGIKHLQEPVPRLPHYLTAFQDVVDQMLAKKPGLRFQTGAELAAALDNVRADVPLPNATIKTQAVTTQEIRAVADNLLTTMRDPHRAERKTEKKRRKRVLRGTGVGLIVVTALAFGGYWLNENPDTVTRALAALGVSQQPGVQQAWNEARALHQDPNQGLATIVAAYGRVLEVDPVHPGAISALAELNDRWRLDISEALDDDDLTAATNKLEDARLAFPDDAMLDAMSAAIEQRQQANSLVAEAEAQLDASGFEDPSALSAALQALAEAQRTVPGHARAQIQLNRIAAHFTALALEAVEGGNMEVAISSIDRASTAVPDYPGLPEARLRVQQATTTRTAIAQMIEQARGFRSQGALVSPPGENAAELYHQVLSIDPSNDVASHGLDELLTQVRTLTLADLERGNFGEAASRIESAAAANLDAEAVDELRRALGTERDRLNSVGELLARAEGMIVDGYLTEPDDANAVTALREVQRLDPDNEKAQRLLQQVAERLADVARDAHGVGLNEQATAYLDLAITLLPNVSDWQRLRQSWAEGPDAR